MRYYILNNDIYFDQLSVNFLVKSGHPVAHGKGTQLTSCTPMVPRPSKLSDPHFLPMEFPQFGHCRGVTTGRAFKPATKPPRIWSCTYYKIMLTRANKMCKNTISCCTKLEKQRRLISMRHTTGAKKRYIK